MRAFLCVQGTPYEEIKDVAGIKLRPLAAVSAYCNAAITARIREIYTDFPPALTVFTYGGQYDFAFMDYLASGEAAFCSMTASKQTFRGVFNKHYAECFAAMMHDNACKNGFPTIHYHVATHYHYLKSVVFATIEGENTCIIRDIQSRDGYVLSTTY